MTGNNLFLEIPTSDYQRISTLVAEFCGFSIDFMQREIIERRTQLYLKKIGLNLSAWINILEKYPEKTTEYIDTICTGEQQIFRDVSFWKVLFNNPERGFPTNAESRILFFDMPTGEDFFTWLILQKTYFPHLCPQIEITTPHTSGLNRIKHKKLVFQKIGSLQNQLSEPFEKVNLLEHLEEMHNTWQITDFSTFHPKIYLHKCIQPFPSGTFHTIFCRNRLLYYTEEICSVIISNLYRAIIPGGYLMTGTHDNPAQIISGGFTIIDKENGIYKK